MPITQVTLRQSRYYPELFPDARVQTIAASAEGAALLELREFRPLGVVTRLVNLSMEQDTDITAHIEADEYQRSNEFNSAAMPSNLVPSEAEYTAMERLRYALINGSAGGAVSDYRTHFGVWAWKPNAAQKLLYGLKLDREEQNLVDKFSLHKRVKNGTLPYDLTHMIRGQYKPIIHRDVRAWRVTQATANVSVVFADYPVRSRAGGDQFMVVRSIAASPGTYDAAGGVGSENVQIHIDRDEDLEIVNVRTAPLALTVNNDLKCWVVGMRKFQFRVQVENAITNHPVRIEVLHLPLTDIHRIRWGLASRDEVDGELWDAVKAGLI